MKASWRHRFTGIAFIAFFCSATIAMAQENVENEVGLKKKHSISIGIGHTQVAKGIEEGSKKWLSLPSWAFDYSFKLNQRWKVGLQNEIILSDFEVESDKELLITRSNPISSIATVGYRPIQHLTLFAGAGAEFAKEENFALLRLGIEPSMEIRERLELLLNVVYDFKIEGYNSFGLSFGIGYAF